MQRRPVCAIEDLPPGSMKLVQAGKFGVGVYNIDGALYAIANYCSHIGGPLCARRCGGTTNSPLTRPSSPERARKGRVVRCPWHTWSSTSPAGCASRIRRRGPHIRGRRRRGAGVSDRMSDHRHECSAHFRYNSEIRRYILGPRKAPWHPRRRIAVVPGAQRRLPRGAVRRRVPG